MIKTVITNTLHTGRSIRWAGIWLDGGETAVLDGAYPYSSNFRKAEQAFDAEVESGAIEVMYVTDFETMTEDEFAAMKGKKKRTRKAVKAAKKEEVPEVSTDDAEAPSDEGDEKVFTKGSIDEVMGKSKQVAGTVSEVIADGETAKLANRMDMDVAEVDTEDAAKKHVSDPLLNAGAIAGNWPNITDAAQAMLEENGITQAEASLIPGTGSDGRLIQKDVKEYLKKKNGE